MLDHLLAMQAQGVVRHIGLSTHTPELAGLVLEGWRSLVPVYRWLCSLPGDPPPEEQ